MNISITSTSMYKKIYTLEFETEQNRIVTYLDRDLNVCYLIFHVKPFNRLIYFSHLGEGLLNQLKKYIFTCS